MQSGSHSATKCQLVQVGAHGVAVEDHVVGEARLDGLVGIHEGFRV